MIMIQLIKFLVRNTTLLMAIIMKCKRPFLKRRDSLLDHKEIMEVDLASLRVVEETLEVMEVIWAMVEEEGVVVEVVAVEVVMEEVMVNIMDFEVMVLVIVVEEAMVAAD
jgi:hypothetical protein